MTRDEALQKIKKCLALAASPNQHEAAAALRQAQKLMEQFGLTDEDVSLADVCESKHAAPSVPLVPWEAALVSVIALVFGCEYYTSTHRKLNARTFRRQRQFVFIGVGMAAEIAGYAFDVLVRQCAKDRRAFIAKQPKACKPKTKVARGDAYAQGWVSGVRGQLEKFAGQPGDAKLIEQYLELRYPNMQKTETKDRTKGKNVSGDEFHHGYQAGKNAEIHRGVGGVADRPLLT